MNKPFKGDVDRLIKKAENTKKYPQKFINTIEYYHSVFAYILSLIEMKKDKSDSSPTPLS